METSTPLRRAASLAVLSLAAGLIGASAAHAEDKAAILLPGSANDQSWNALGYSILKSLEPHGFKTAFSEQVAPDFPKTQFIAVSGNEGKSPNVIHR